MKEEKKWEAQRCFYEKCSEILGLSPHFIEPETRLTRWNNRHPGNGRYPGFGQIRMFSPKLIHVSLNHPVKINRTFSSEQEVYSFLLSLMSEEAVRA